jgi:hypothetical protein
VTPRLRRSAYRPGTLVPVGGAGGGPEKVAVLVRRDSLQPGDIVVSSHYGERAVESCTQYGDEGQTTELRFVHSGERVLNERYDSAQVIPLVRRAGSLGSVGELLRSWQLPQVHAAIDGLQLDGERLAARA